MSQRRMFSPDIIASDAFLDMPVSSQALYFHLGMNADDDGFVNPNRVMRLIGASQDDLKVLLAKRFLLPFENGVVVIKHWLIHNMIRKDRYKETLYLEEKKKLLVKENGAYTELATERQPLGNQPAPQVRLGKVRLGKDNTEATKVAHDEVDLEMSKLLRDLIQKNTPTFKEPNIERWATDCRLMRERDKRTPEQIRYLVEWSQKSTFWQANILSMRKLREKFDVLVAQVKREKNKGSERLANVIL